MNDVHVRDGVIKGMYAVNATDHKALTRVVGDDIRDVSGLSRQRNVYLKGNASCCGTTQ